MKKSDKEEAICEFEKVKGSFCRTLKDKCLPVHDFRKRLEINHVSFSKKLYSSFMSFCSEPKIKRKITVKISLEKMNSFLFIT